MVIVKLLVFILLLGKSIRAANLTCGDKICTTTSTPVPSSTISSSSAEVSTFTPTLPSSSSFTDIPTWGTPPVSSANKTLENKYEENPGWKIPRDTIPKWFEYYNSTTHFNSEIQNSSRCASILQDFGTLSEADGIWAACQDPYLPAECFVFSSSPCYPILSYETESSHFNQLRTIKISFALYGLAILRLYVDNICIDYSRRQDPFSECSFSQIFPTGWLSSRFIFNPSTNTSFRSFSVELIARFANDVVLLDKIEATEHLLCGPDTDCTTTPLPPTTTRQTWPSTEPPEFTSPPSNNKTVILDISPDPNPFLNHQWWSIPCTATFPRWLEYYPFTSSFSSPFHTNSCANAFYQEYLATSLEDVGGIWVACKDPGLPLEECATSSRAPCHPFIRFMGMVERAIGRIHIYSFLYGQGTIRLHLNNGKCIDYANEKDLNSTCEFVEAPGNPRNEWLQIHYESEKENWVTDFRIDMIAKEDHDFVLIDKVVVEISRVCEYSPNGCPDYGSTESFTIIPTQETTLKTSEETDMTTSTEGGIENSSTAATISSPTTVSTSSRPNSGTALSAFIASKYTLYIFVCFVTFIVNNS